MTSGNSDVPIYNREPEAQIPSIHDYFGMPIDSFDVANNSEIEETNGMINTNKSPVNHPMRMNFAVI